MKNVTVRLSEDYVETLDDEAGDAGMSRAEYIRDLIKQGRDAEETQAELDETQAELAESRERLSKTQDELAESRDELAEREQRIENLKRENERIRNEKRLILEQREEHTDLVREVRQDRTLAERKARAGLLTKTKWALFGMGEDEES